MTAAGPRAVRAVSWERWPDNVVRQQEFRERNPDAEFAGERKPAGFTWTGSLVVDGKRMTVTCGDLGVLLGELEPLAEARQDAVGRLKLAWGDLYEDIRFTVDGWYKGRRRDGDGRELAAQTADGLNHAFRSDQEREIIP